MCGITGYIDRANPNEVASLTRCMRDEMIARGPDGIGDYVEDGLAMSMRRLSIIDLEGGGQPLMSRAGLVVAFQNGEIYNYRELSQELRSLGFEFSTQSDTEVLAHGYAAWGIDGLLSRIDGMYGLAILDRKSRVLHLARDRFGEKPLFYAYAPQRFAYASSLLSLSLLPWVDTSIHSGSLNKYLALHYVPGDRTIFSGVWRVLPGERLEIPVDSLQVRRFAYYRLPLESGPPVSLGELRSQIEHAVKSRLIADVPVGVFLSGGVDSSLIAAIAAKNAPHINTFSIAFKHAALDESQHARAVARHIHSTHHEFVFDEDSFRSLLPLVAGSLDEPVGDQALLPVFWLSREARKYVKVVLSGEGADEIFAGYSYYSGFSPKGRTAWNRLCNALQRRDSNVETLKSVLNDSALTTPSGFPLLTDRETRRRLLMDSVDDHDAWELDFLDKLKRAADPLQRATCADLLTWLPDDLLVKLDRMAMANSLEGRAPYLEPNLVFSAIARLKPEQRFFHGNAKPALREVARGWLPSTIFQRHKQGFVLPLKKWVSEWLHESGGAEQYFKEAAVDGLDSTEVGRLAAADIAVGVHNERLLFALVLLAEWHVRFRQTQLVLRGRVSKSEF